MSLTEQDIENAFIQQLTELKYTYRPNIRDKASLEQNFRAKFQVLNKVNLTDDEFPRLLQDIISADTFTAAKTLRERNTFMREDGTPLQYTLVNTKDWCKNTFEVINQLRINTDNSYHRYDVILLINGIPVVQIELKTLEVVPRKAMEQLIDYKHGAGNGYTNTLLCFMQLFIVSNRSKTYYFANNQAKHFAFNADERFLPIYQLANADNEKITHLHDFSQAFLAKCALGEMISRYMVLVESEQKLMIMRPYQIYAVKAIVDCIHDNRGNGYIWHTTGSGKTLTSFKASTLLKDNPDIDKCLFVVDRKDLDRQTRDEFNKFQAGCVEENTNTEALVRRLLSEDYADKVIVTTIQKLGLALDENSKRNQANKQKGKATYKQRLAGLSNKRMVFIFDECHRSQFGDNHQAIKNFFPKAQLFGFTGTPIFEENASYKQIDGTEASLVTTEDIFQQQLHAYTITHAIEDKNVLCFHIDYYGKNNPAKQKTKAGEAPPPQAVIDTILDKHLNATDSRRFNAILATSSINAAIEYYQLFKTTQAQRQTADENYQTLNIACVFSPPAEGNNDVKQLQEDLAQEKADNQQDPDQKKAALTAIMNDYNTQYGTNHRISEFDNYYKDIQDRIKVQKFPNRDYPQQNKIDITIVVDMLLTGFDSQYLNTLYVDKNLKHHGLIQAFSRTNRVLNDTKPYGQIIDFRYQENAVDNAIKLFSGQDDLASAKKIWEVAAAPEVIQQLDTAMNDLQIFMQSQGLACAPEAVSNLKGDEARGEFIKQFKEIQRLKTQLDQYTDLTEAQQQNIESIITAEQQRAFRGVYLDIAQQLKAQQGKTATPEMEQLDFEFVLFASATIDYDYIMKLIAKHTQAKPSKQKASREQLVQLLLSNANLREESADITAYIDSLQTGVALTEDDIQGGYQAFKAKQAKRELNTLAQQHGLDAERLQGFVDNIMQYRQFDDEALSDLLAPLELGWRERRPAEQALMQDLKPVLNKLVQGQDIAGLTAYE